MPPKQHYTREDILDAALALVREEGLPGLSVRKIAEALGCSTAPVYTYCKDMEEVREAVMEKALELLMEYTDRAYTGDAFLNVGVGLLVYARENPVLYRELFLNGSRFSHMLRKFNDSRIITLQNESHGVYLGPDKVKAIYDKLAVFTHGLAAMVCAGMLSDTSDGFFVQTLGEVGSDFYGSALYRGGQTTLLKEWMDREHTKETNINFRLDIK